MARALRYGFLTLALLLFSSEAMGQQARLAAHKVENVQNRVLVTWQAEVEVDVAAYELRRRTPNSTGFVLLTTLSAQGAGKPYAYTDGDLYKAVSAMADYELTAVYRNGTRQLLFTAQVNYTTTGLRRTWGSLKAMFQ